MSLKNRKIIITGGPTREWIDPVRYISNPSSGKMGIALADAAYNISREAVFIHGPIDRTLVLNRGYKTLAVETTEELLKAVLNELSSCSVLIMAAAPCDYKPVKKALKKIKKDGSDLILNLKATPDILKNVASVRSGNKELHDLFTVGFAAETDKTEEYALKKLKEKNLDMICLNDVTARGAGFGVDTNIITIFTRTGEKIELPMLSKKEAALKILEQIDKMI